jgi:hypothetical protein
MFKLGKSAAEMLQAWQTVLGDNSLKKQLCMTVTCTSKVSKNCWKTSIAVGEIQVL